MRTVDPSDRRVRIPQITDNGRKVYATFAEARALDGVDASDRVLLLDVLAKIANSPDTADATT